MKRLLASWHNPETGKNETRTCVSRREFARARDDARRVGVKYQISNLTNGGSSPQEKLKEPCVRIHFQPKLALASIRR